jgi:phosphopantothenoylcysteine decarboxylase/phosphopantothenate--cysteine ligase
MWTNPIVQANVRRLTEVGFHFVGPVAGDLAFGKGPGRLADPAVIVAACREVAGKRSGPLSGKTVLVTAGRTEEPLDPVRALSNRSSGRMGFALAAAARDLGARVVLVAGAASVPPPAGVQLLEASTAETMRARVLAELEHADALIMAAAVADYRPKVASPEKIRRQAKPLHLELEPTPDILAEAGKRKGGRILVGFALETGDNGVASAREKLIAKNLDLVVVNQADEAIGADTNRVMLVDGKGERPLPVLPKMEVAQVILAEVVQRMGNARLPGRRAAKGRK